MDAELAEVYVIIDNRLDSPIGSFLLPQSILDEKILLGKDIYKMYPIRHRLGTELISKVDFLLYRYFNWVRGVLGDIPQDDIPRITSPTPWGFEVRDRWHIKTFKATQDIHDDYEEITSILKKARNRSKSEDVRNGLDRLLDRYVGWLMEYYTDKEPPSSPMDRASDF